MTISYSPTTPIPGEAVSLSATVAGLHSSYLAPLRCRLTSVPDASTLDLGYLRSADGSYLDTFTPDVAGAYSVAVDVHWRFTAPPSYQGDPVGDRRERYRETQTSTVYVGSPMALRIDARGGHGATLAIVVANDRIQTAEIRSPLTESSRIAALACTAELAAVVGEAVDATPDLTATVDALRAAMEGHFPFIDPHVTPDDVNTVSTSPPWAQVTAIALLGAVSRTYQLHSNGPNATTWHDYADTLNQPVTAPGLDDASAFVHACDLVWRCYARHLNQTSDPASHDRADRTNVVRDPSALEALIVAYLDALAALTPSTPTGEQEGAVLVARRLGFLAE